MKIAFSKGKQVPDKCFHVFSGFNEVLLRVLNMWLTIRCSTASDQDVFKTTSPAQVSSRFAIITGFWVIFRILIILDNLYPSHGLSFDFRASIGEGLHMRFLCCNVACWVWASLRSDSRSSLGLHWWLYGFMGDEGADLGCSGVYVGYDQGSAKGWLRYGRRDFSGFPRVWWQRGFLLRVILRDMLLCTCLCQ